MSKYTINHILSNEEIKRLQAEQRAAIARRLAVCLLIVGLVTALVLILFPRPSEGKMAEATQAMKRAIHTPALEDIQEVDEPYMTAIATIAEAPVEELEEEAAERIYLGTFTATAYCPCEKCCGKWSNTDNPITASGASCEAGVTVGADWATLPVGTVIEIEGYGMRTVQDKPAQSIIEKYEGKILDIYFEDHQEALNFGRRQVEVWKVR